MYTGNRHYKYSGGNANESILGEDIRAHLHSAMSLVLINIRGHRAFVSPVNKSSFVLKDFIFELRSVHMSTRFPGINCCS